GTPPVTPSGDRAEVPRSVEGASERRPCATSARQACGVRSRKEALKVTPRPRRPFFALLAASCLLMLSGGSPLLAADETILGKKVLIADPTAVEDNRQVLGLGKESATSLPSRRI